MGYSDENFRRDAPWRDRDRKAMVRVTQTLVCDYEVTVPEDADEDTVRERALAMRTTPAQAACMAGEDDWYLENEKVELI